MSLCVYTVCHTHRHGEDAFLVVRDESDDTPPLCEVDFMFEDPSTFELWRMEEALEISIASSAMDAALERLRELEPNAGALADVLSVHKAPLPADKAFEKMIEAGHKAYHIRSGEARYDGESFDVAGATCIAHGGYLYLRSRGEDGSTVMDCVPAGDVAEMEWGEAA